MVFGLAKLKHGGLSNPAHMSDARSRKHSSTAGQLKGVRQVRHPAFVCVTERLISGGWVCLHNLTARQSFE